VVEQITLAVDSDLHRPRSRCVSVHNLHPDVTASLRGSRRAGGLLRSVLRVRVIGAGGLEAGGLPDILGVREVWETGLRFIPHFPFEAELRFRAIFDPRPLGIAGLSEVLTLEFSFPEETCAAPTQVKQVFPSYDALPENLLRFYLCFSSPMQRGYAEANITLFGAEGRPVPDVLYRPPVELWDRSMKCLTILLDPGRIKRWVGPNRALGAPLKGGQACTLAISSRMLDFSGRPLRESFYKSFRVIEAVREPVAVKQWRILPPATHSRQPLELVFPKPLDWGSLGHSISIAADDNQPIDGRISIDQCERRWSFTPEARWTSGLYRIRIAQGLEDVCGNNLTGPFDRPLLSAATMDFQSTSKRL
jgi:hypothetical protein